MTCRLAIARSIAALVVTASLAGASAWAQPAPATTAPSASAIVEALKPTTRSLRNLIVARPDAAASADVARGPAAASDPVATATSGGISSPPATPAAAPSISMAIQFDFDSARIRAESLLALDHLAAALATADLRASRFLIEGHTDATGSAGYNLRLSELRAAEVKRYLVAHGVGAERVATVGRGSTQPADAEHPAAAENRRVRVVNVD